MSVSADYLPDRIALTDDEHLLWLGRIRSDGYGTLGSRLAHRAVWELVVGPVPDGHELDHLAETCGRRDCVAPWHLEPVVHAENMRRIPRQNFGRANRHKTHCKRGHEFSPENTYRTARGRSCRKCLAAHARKYRRRR